VSFASIDDVVAAGVAWPQNQSPLTLAWRLRVEVTHIRRFERTVKLGHTNRPIGSRVRGTAPGARIHFLLMLTRTRVNGRRRVHSCKFAVQIRVRSRFKRQNIRNRHRAGCGVRASTGVYLRDCVEPTALDDAHARNSYAHATRAPASNIQDSAARATSPA